MGPEIIITGCIFAAMGLFVYVGMRGAEALQD